MWKKKLGVVNCFNLEIGKVSKITYLINFCAWEKEKGKNINGGHIYIYI